MSNKNPFEIRAEVMELAKDYMDKQQQLNLEFANRMVEEGLKTLEEVQSYYKMYSVDDLQEMAKKMYSFVTTKE